MNTSGTRLAAIVGIAIVTLALLATGLRAEPVRNKMLEDVRISGQGPCAVINVGFTFPVRYEKHFPLESGTELRIQVKPIAVSPEDRNALFKREAVTAAKFDDRVPLREVVYEGDIAGGPFLTLFFARKVRFEVRTGRDFRSLSITLPGPESGDGCEPEQAE